MDRFEKLLIALLNGDSTDIVPRKRMEQYLKACCDKVDCSGLPEPRKRAEFLLYQLAEQLAGGGSGGGGTSEDLNAVLTEQESLIAELKSTLEGKSAGGSGSSVKLQEKTVTPTKLQQVVNADTGYDGLSKVTVEPIPTEYIKPTGTKNITQNGTFSIKSYAEASVNVQPNLQEKTATENGEVTPDTGYDGLSKVVVNVTASGGSNKLAQFADGTLTEITAEDLEGVTSIAEYAFYRRTSLESVILPDSVTTLHSSTFYRCTSLVSATMGSGLSVMRGDNFRDCTKLEYVDFTRCTKVTAIPDSKIFNGAPSTCEIRVPAALVDEWKAATNWSTYASQIVGV